ncbi:hypothetical protein L1987_64066 [Smallanthus sonchifolius]|uniref:Uncharacterized protein n=1 Tax=Smallanthus sonchifolius TaxID=185202 RepID=A0ACB9CEW6_9ASTR|nr:hypothetical protein L1987_64066 [Smallanthus sonchifolius]
MIHQFLVLRNYVSAPVFVLIEPLILVSQSDEANMPQIHARRANAGGAGEGSDLVCPRYKTGLNHPELAKKQHKN